MNNLPLVLIGAGGHAKVLIEALQLTGRTMLGIADPALAAGSTGPFDLKILGGDEAVNRFASGDVMLINCVGSSKTMELRDSVYRRFKSIGFRFATVTHPSAIISPSAMLGEGAQIMAGGVIQASASVGANSIVNTRASVDHDCAIGESVHIAPGATLSGSVTVGDCVHVGAGATVIQGITIGRDSLVAAGAIVYRDLPARSCHIKAG